MKVYDLLGVEFLPSYIIVLWEPLPNPDGIVCYLYSDDMLIYLALLEKFL